MSVIKKILFELCAVVVLCAMFFWMFSIWAKHPAEQPISEAAYTEIVRGYSR